MGLDYLMKKTWHTASIQNIERVWNAEQQELNKRKKEGQRLKQLQEERSNQRIKRLQVQAGQIPASHLDRMEWMYNDSSRAQQQKTAEEHLMGKPLQKIPEKIQFSNYSQQVTSEYKEQITNSQCENFALLHEDPLFHIAQMELQQQQEILNNPLKMKMIYQEVEQTKNETHDKLKEKNINKQEKKSKKEKQSKQEQKQSQEGKKLKQTSNQSDSSERSRSQDKKNKQHDNRDKKRRHDSRSSSSSSDSSKSSVSSSQSREIKIPINQSNQINSVQTPKGSLYQDYMQKIYGNLVVQDENGIAKIDYGVMKRVAKRQANGVDFKKLNEQQRNKLVEQMKKDAEILNDSKQMTIKSNYGSTSGVDDQSKTAEFLHGMRKDIYNKDTNLNSLSERMGRNKNNLEKVKD